MDTVKYSKGKIYVLKNTIDGSIFYCGSTCKTLNLRLEKHKGSVNSKTKGNSNVYEYIKEIGKNNFVIELVELYPCESNAQLRLREHEVCEKLKEEGYNLQNSRVPFLTEEKKKKDKKISDRKYFVSNKDKWKEIRETIIRCDCGSEVSKPHITRHYRSKKHQEYLGVKNPSPILNDCEKKHNSRNLEKVSCLCGAIFKRSGRNRHEESSKHKSFRAVYDFIWE